MARIRDDHRIMIEQDVGGENHYAILWLIDIGNNANAEAGTGFTSWYGSWHNTADTYNDEFIRFSTDNPQWLRWEWRGGPRGGDLSIGVKMSVDASHKEGEGPYFQVLIVLNRARRNASDRWEVASVIPPGTGWLTYDVHGSGGSLHFRKGEILWSVAESGHPWGRALNP